MTSNRPYLLRAVHEWICDNGLTPYVVIDATRSGVQVPPQSITDGRVVLNLAPRAVAKLEIGNDMITCMARFGGASHPIAVPLAAVQAIYAHENGQGMLLAEDAPGTVPAVETDGAPAPVPRSPAPSLQAVPSDDSMRPESGPDESGPGGADNDTPDKPRPKGKPTLHVVK